MEPKFMISEVFGTSWKYTKSQIWVLVGLFIGYFILSSIISLFGMPAQGSMVGKIIVNLISAVISSAFMLGYIKNLFQTMDGEEPQFSAYGQQSRKIFTYLIASIIMGIAVAIGIFLLIVPGIYLAIRLQFYSAYIVEEDCGIIESLQKSWDLTKGQGMPLFFITVGHDRHCDRRLHLVLRRTLCRRSSYLYDAVLHIQKIKYDFNRRRSTTTIISNYK